MFFTQTKIYTSCIRSDSPQKKVRKVTPKVLELVPSKVTWTKGPEQTPSDPSQTDISRTSNLWFAGSTWNRICVMVLPEGRGTTVYTFLLQWQQPPMISLSCKSSKSSAQHKLQKLIFKLQMEILFHEDKKTNEQVNCCSNTCSN